MTDERDVAAFGARAGRYDEGRLGRFHHEVGLRVASIAESAAPQPHRVLDIGCGTGHLLGLMADHDAGTSALIGVDASAAMVEVARAAATDERVAVRVGTAERLPFADGEFDLVVSTTSFDHWHDQAAGLRECARVLRPGGVAVIADLFSPVLAVTLTGTRRDKARTRARAERLIADAGLLLTGWHRVHVLVQAFVARKGDVA